MAIRCFGRLAAGFDGALAATALEVMIWRAADLATAFGDGDFFNAAVRLAALDVGFCLAIAVLPFRLSGKTSTNRAS